MKTPTRGNSALKHLSKHRVTMKLEPQKDLGCVSQTGAVSTPSLFRKSSVT